MYGAPVANVFFDSPAPDEQRRRALYDGDLFVLRPQPAAVALADIARRHLIDGFEGHDPQTAQHTMAVEAYAAVLSQVKPAFIHDVRCKRLISELVEQAGADPDLVYFDVPRLRSATAQQYLTTGIAFAFHPHRDMWYSAPPQQINWWFPVYDITPENGLAFHTRWFSEPVPNSSEGYNYYRWNAESRGAAASMVAVDTREQPKALAPVELDPDIRVVAPVGAPLLFSPQHLHSTVPNTTDVTRFSIDFRTVHLDDLVSGRGAKLVDSRCTGTTLRDFVRCSDLAPLPSDVIEMYDDDSSKTYAEHLVFPAAAGTRAR